MNNKASFKLAHITLSMGPAGVEHFIINFARRLNRKCFDLTVGCLDAGGVLLDEIHSLGCSSFVLSRQSGLDWRLVVSLARIFSKQKFDIVHTHNQAAHFYAGLAAKISRVPCLITTEHSRHYIEERRIRRLEKLILSSFTDRWVNVSQELAQLSIEKDGLLSKKVRVIPNGIDIERFRKPMSFYNDYNDIARMKKGLGIPSDAKLAIMVARLHPIKNHKILLQAVAAIKERIKNVHIILVGDGELRDDLMELAQQLGIGNRIHFLGYRQDIPELLWLSDLFVLCSFTEGMPLSLLEAMAAGVPVIIARTANKAGVITDGVNGKVVETDTKALAVGLANILENQDHYKRLAENGFEFVSKHFSLETMMKQYESLYEEILERKQKTQ